MFNRDLLFNACWFYCLWFSAVLGQQPYIAVTVALVLVHCVIHRQQTAEAALIAVVAGVGICTDQLLVFAGVFVFPDSHWLPGWLCMLWAGFAGTLRHSLKFASHSLWLAVLFGALGGSSSYFAGFKLGAVGFGYNTTATIVLLAIIWAALLPMFFKINRWISGKIQ